MRGFIFAVLSVVIGCSSSNAGSGSDGGDQNGRFGGKGGAGGTQGGVGSDVDAGAGGASGGGGAGGADVGGDASDGATAGAQIVRTLAYHQLSLFTANPTGPAAISADGTRIAYPVAPGTGDPAQPNRIFIMNPDGTGNLEVDSYKSNCFCGSQVAISGDGRTVASTDSTQVRIAGSDATKKGSVSFDSNEISDIAITADGGKVFMLHRRDNKVTGGVNVERGLWSVNSDGTGFAQLAGATSVAPLFGTTPDKVFPFNGCGKSLEVSGDGRRLIIALEVGGMGQFVLVGDVGAQLRKLVGPVQFVSQVAISSDGNKVAYFTQDQGKNEVAVTNFDGSGSRVLSTQSQGSCFAAIRLNADGSQLLSADLGLLFPTSGGDPITLYNVTEGDGIAVGAPWSNVTPQFSMTGDGKRFAYWSKDAALIQLALLEVNPSSLGAAPSLSSPTLSAASLPRDRSIGASATCKISGGGTLVRAGTAVLLRGVEDTAGSWVSGRHVLRDDGMKGDATASDGVFTSDGDIAAGTGADVGPRIIRAKAEAKAADGRMHATAIDVSGLEVK